MSHSKTTLTWAHLLDDITPRAVSFTNVGALGIQALIQRIVVKLTNM